MEGKILFQSTEGKKKAHLVLLFKRLFAVNWGMKVCIAHQC